MAGVVIDRRSLADAVGHACRGEKVSFSIDSGTDSCTVTFDGGLPCSLTEARKKELAVRVGASKVTTRTDHTWPPTGVVGLIGVRVEE